MKQIKAVIFDMDGLMFDTEKLWFDSVETVNKTHNTGVPMSVIYECAGFRDDKTDARIMEVMGENFNLKRFRKLTDNAQNKDVKQNGLRIKPGLNELLDYLTNNNIDLVLASSSTTKQIKYCFKAAKVNLKLFKHIVAGNMVTEPKPHPQMYKVAKALTNFPNENVLVLEDSEVGVMSAHEAGLKVIMIPDIKQPSPEVEKMAYKKLDNLTQVVDVIKNLNKRDME